MAVVAELTVQPTQFPLGSLLTAGTKIHIEFERIVPVGPSVIPIFWAWNGDSSDFEERVRTSRYVSNVTELDRVEDRVLYLMEWEIPEEAFLEGLHETNGIIRNATGYDDQNWSFELLFPSYDDLSEFHNYCLDNDIDYTLGRIYTLREVGRDRPPISITDSQREALVLALQRGYFASPSRVTLDELASELGISQQALSERIRRGNEALLEQSLLENEASPERE